MGTHTRDSEELLFCSAGDAAGMLARKELSSRELTQLLLERIDAINPALNAVVELRAELALDDAARADRALAEGDARPLLGVPITIKEAFDVAGMRTTWGNPAFRDDVADADATVVARLKQAGAVVVGKTNVHFMLGDFAQTVNELYGATANPWDTSLTPGGSSGGSAAAVAAGMSFTDFGTDLVGSIRIPASFCGVYGLRPSTGVVPLTGMQAPGAPALPSEASYMSTAGPFGRSAADLRTALAVTAGPEASVARAYAWSLSPPRQRRIEAYSVGVVLDHERAPVSSDLGGALSDAVDALARAGATVVEGWPQGVDPLASYESFGYHVQLFLAHAQPHESFAGLSELVEQQLRRAQLRAAWGRYFADMDVFLCPANFTAAFPHDSRPFEERTIGTPAGQRPYADQPFWTAHAALAGLPCVVAPAGSTRQGLPVGVQVVGPPFEDDTAITLAELLTEVVGGYRRPEGIAPGTARH